MIEGVLRDHEGPHAAYLVSRFCDPLAQAHDADHLQVNGNTCMWIWNE